MREAQRGGINRGFIFRHDAGCKEKMPRTEWEMASCEERKNFMRSILKNDEDEILFSCP